MHLFYPFFVSQQNVDSIPVLGACFSPCTAVLLQARASTVAVNVLVNHAMLILVSAAYWRETEHSTYRARGDAFVNEDMRAAHGATPKNAEGND